MTATASSTGAAAGTATLGVKQIVTVSKTVHKSRIRQKKNEKSMYTQFFLKDAGLLLYEDMVKQM